MKDNIAEFKEEKRQQKLWKSARSLSRLEVKAIKHKLKSEAANLDLRFQILSYYSVWTKDGRLKHKGAQRRLFEQVSWLVDHHPDIASHFGYELLSTNYCFSPNRFARLRDKWIRQVEALPGNASVLGNAATFISSRDKELACTLYERAFDLQPNQHWLERLVSLLSQDMSLTPGKYDKEVCLRVIDAGMRSLQTEAVPEHSMICGDIADAAWAIGDFETVRNCAEMLVNTRTGKAQIGHSYLGLLALKDSNRAEAIARLLCPPRVGPYRQRLLLARELSKLGERDSIITLINEWCPDIGHKAKSRWLAQIANGETVNFENHL